MYETFTVYFFCSVAVFESACLLRRETRTNSIDRSFLSFFVFRSALRRSSPNRECSRCAFYSRGYSRVLQQFATISTRSGSPLFINGADPFRNDSTRGRGDDLTGRKFARFRNSLHLQLTTMKFSFYRENKIFEARKSTLRCSLHIHLFFESKKLHGIIDAELRLHLMKDWHEEEQRLEQSKCKNMIA